MTIKQPTKEEIKEFLENYLRLEKFEGQHRLIRNWGAYSKEEMDKWPNEALVKTRQWLEALSK